jgi:hypothetical protein
MPSALTALSVPLFGLPAEVVLQDELNNAVGQIQAAVDQEATARTQAVAAVQTSVDQEAITRAAAVDAEATTRAGQDRALGDRLTANEQLADDTSAALHDEVSARQTDQRNTQIALRDMQVAVGDAQDAASAAQDTANLLQHDVGQLGQAGSQFKVDFSNITSIPSGQYVLVHAESDLCDDALHTLEVKCPDGYIFTGCAGSLDRGAFVGTKPLDDFRTCSAAGHGPAGLGHLPGGVCATFPVPEQPGHLRVHAICVQGIGPEPHGTALQSVQQSGTLDGTLNHFE